MNTIEIKLSNKEKASFSMEGWCECKVLAEHCFKTSEFKNDEECNCGVIKHHYHGGVCGKITQIG